MAKKKPVTQTVVWTPPPPALITADELHRLSERALHQYKMMRKGNTYVVTMLYRLALDAMSLGLLMDRAAGQKRLDMWVRVTQKKLNKRKSK